jgi:cytochrome c peroxidase
VPSTRHPARSLRSVGRGNVLDAFIGACKATADRREVERIMATKYLFVAGSIALSVASPAIAADDAALLKEARQIFQPLPKYTSGPGTTLAKEQVALGHLLFFDPRITADGDVCCATCHQPALYGTDGRPTSIGVKQRPHPRNAPTIFNAAVYSVIHWRGDRNDLEDQAEQALTGAISSGLDERDVTERLRRIEGYRPLFAAAFPIDLRPMTVKNMANAIVAYERTLLTPAPFDAYLAGNVDALSPAARKGLETFINTGCVACHNGVSVGGDMYRKFGIVEDYWSATGSRSIDKGRVEVTKNPDDLYVFRVPSLRNVAMTAPYFHDGSVATLAGAVKIMGRVQLGMKLGDLEINEIVSFLNSLTGDLPTEFVAPAVLPPAAVTAPQR